MENTKKKKFKVMILDHVDGHRVYKLIEKDCIPFICYSYDFLAHNDGHCWFVYDKKSGTKVLCTHALTLEEATKELRSIFGKYLGAIQTQEYNLLCGLYRDLLKE